MHVLQSVKCSLRIKKMCHKCIFYVHCTELCHCYFTVIHFHRPLYTGHRVAHKELAKENRIYIRVKFRKSFGMNFVSQSSKCTNHVNVHKLYAVEYINTVCSLDYP